MHLAPGTWRQLNLRLSQDPAAEAVVAAELGQQLRQAETAGTTAAWFFIRKQGWWRLRYQPGPGVSDDEATTAITAPLTDLRNRGSVREWVQAIYEPEVPAFGGTDGMRIAHQLFHHDSRSALAYQQETAAGQPDHRRELSLLLTTALLRAAGQEWTEQGDVWARVLATRPLHGPPTTRPAALHTAVARLLAVDTSPDTPLLTSGPLARVAHWMAGFRTAGTDLGALAHTGRLTRGLRAVLAYHVLFAWNRIGLRYQDQHTLAATARGVILDDELDQQIADTHGNCINTRLGSGYSGGGADFDDDELVDVRFPLAEGPR
ncbi:thiopeptide-type bacteriocin biosynthesis protein [Micromonospora sp. WMMA1923]|uniref:thiopeptide-type bacteriocin biosynthesis protein n=1 Tax=Micromonospora sp. WMMA1923 TaxID=3404125 RepID=UPI003B927F65